MCKIKLLWISEEEKLDFKERKNFISFFFSFVLKTNVFQGLFINVVLSGLFDIVIAL